MIQGDLVVLLKWCPLADSGKMAPPGGLCYYGIPGGYFSHVHKQLARFQIIIFSEQFVARLAFSNGPPPPTYNACYDCYLMRQPLSTCCF